MIRTLLFLSISILLFSCKAPEARKPINTLSGSFIDQSISRSKKLARNEEAEIKKIMDRDSLNNYLTSDGGFWYSYMKKDTVSSITPQFGDIVNFNYDVRDLYGNVIYNQEELDTISYAIDKEELFFGLREGLKLMKEGEVVTFLIPSYQAYGYYGDNNKIGTNIPLISKVTLHTITQQSTKEN